MSKSLEEYLNADPKALLASVAFTVENELPKITEHLQTLNNSVAKNTSRLNNIEMEKRIRSELEYKLSRKQVVTIGSAGAGCAAFVAMSIYYLIQLFQ